MYPCQRGKQKDNASLGGKKTDYIKPRGMCLDA